ncbi:MAG: hypothetical protein H0X17_10475, partial [Deltaproteobacteria bacterium]|nr:hypothetical protein [Deltaproteobacteria bacterium]
MRPRILIALLVLGAIAAAGWYFWLRADPDGDTSSSSAGGVAAGGAGGAGTPQ